MVQGDSYQLKFSLKSDGYSLDLTTIDSIEFCVGSITKLYPSVVTYDSIECVFLLPLTQQETFSFGTTEKIQVRIKYLNGNVIGSNKSNLNVQESISKVVL